MRTEPIAKYDTTAAEAPAAHVMLLDCYMELIAYTGYVIGQIKAAGAPGHEAVAKVYEDLLARSESFATSMGYSKEIWLAGFFPVCAYIDEALLCSDWPQKDQWERDQLQRKYFNTTAAGWEFFERLDNLEAASMGLRKVYEFCLALGFKGRYFRASDIGRVEDIQFSQLKGVTNTPGLVYPKTLFPEAYEPEAAVKQRKRNRWKKFSLLFPAAVVLPLIAFAALYFIFNRLLDQTVAQYFGTGF